MERKESIYRLRDKDGVIFYVGKTKSLKDRVVEHKKRFGEDITIEEIDRVPVRIVSQIERWYIGFYKFKLGYPLVNKVKTDRGVWGHMPDWRESSEFVDKINMLEKQLLAKTSDEDAIGKGLITYSLFHQQYLKLKDEVERHVHFMREVDPSYSFSLKLEY